MTIAAESEAGPRWGQSLAEGAPGLALRDIMAAREGISTWQTARDSIAAMTRHPVNAGIGASLYQGAPAVAFVLNLASQPWTAAAQHTLDQHIASLTTARLSLARQRISGGHEPQTAEYDLIRGLTGLGAYHLSRHHTAALTIGVLRYLVALTWPLPGSGRALPGWWCATGPSGRADHVWAGGHANLGMAHGITGVLALLSAAMTRGVEVTGQAAAITMICEFLDHWQQGHGRDVWWPETISRAEHDNGSIRQARPGRPSWCYGTPGVARAQQLAGLALGDPARTQLAEQALTGCLNDPGQLRQLTDASLCHGWAGTLQTAWRIARDMRHPAILDPFINRLHAELNHHLARHGRPAAPGLLLGAVGIDLAQATTIRRSPPAAAWDACLLLTP